MNTKEGIVQIFLQKHEPSAGSLRLWNFKVWSRVSQLYISLSWSYSRPSPPGSQAPLSMHPAFPNQHTLGGWPAFKGNRERMQGIA